MFTQNKFILALAFFFALTSCLKLNAANSGAGASFLQEVKIISADKLDYSSNESALFGNVKIQIKDFKVDSPEVLISSKTKKDATLEFKKAVSLASKDLKISGDHAFVDVAAEIIKCYSNGNAQVQSVISNEGEADSLLLADYQEFDYAKKTGIASGHIQYLQNGNNSEAINISSKKLFYKLNTSKNNELELINFMDDVVALSGKEKDQKRIESDNLFYYPSLKSYKASDDVSLTYNGAYLFADSLIFEQEKNISTAYSYGLKPNAEFLFGSSYGKSRQITLTFNGDSSNFSPDKAYFTGNSYVQYDDKAIEGYEIVLDIQSKKVESIIGRSKTLVLEKTASNINAAKSRK